jgi:hypothetical protein
MTFGEYPAPIPCSAFNHDGTIYAYAISYDWSRGFQVCGVGACSLLAAVQALALGSSMGVVCLQLV